MAGLEDLYREIILDHYKSPRLQGELDPPAGRAVGYNPLCGDEVVVTVAVQNGAIADIRTTGQGCSISKSSASMMAQAVKGKTLVEVGTLTRAFKEQLSIRDEDAEEHDYSNVKLGELEALRGVMKFPSRIKCATLAWNTLAQAVQDAAPAAELS